MLIPEISKHTKVMPFGTFPEEDVFINQLKPVLQSKLYFNTSICSEHIEKMHHGISPFLLNLILILFFNSIITLPMGVDTVYFVFCIHKHTHKHTHTHTHTHTETLRHYDTGWTTLTLILDRSLTRYFNNGFRVTLWEINSRILSLLLKRHNKSWHIV